jgi:hypothetical protein
MDTDSGFVCNECDASFFVISDVEDVDYCPFCGNKITGSEEIELGE